MVQKVLSGEQQPTGKMKRARSRICFKGFMERLNQRVKVDKGKEGQEELLGKHARRMKTFGGLSPMVTERQWEEEEKNMVSPDIRSCSAVSLLYN